MAAAHGGIMGTGLLMTVSRSSQFDLPKEPVLSTPAVWFIRWSPLTSGNSANSTEKKWYTKQKCFILMLSKSSSYQTLVVLIYIKLIFQWRAKWLTRLLSQHHLCPGQRALDRVIEMVRNAACHLRGLTEPSTKRHTGLFPSSRPTFILTNTDSRGKEKLPTRGWCYISDMPLGARQ